MDKNHISEYGACLEKGGIDEMLQVEMRQNNIDIGFAHSSKGNQMKWLQDGYWYKADQFGYESLAETVTSSLLQESHIENVTRYEPVYIIYKGKQYRGCRSKNFRQEEEVLVSLERLFRSHTTIGLARQLARITNVKDKLRYTEEVVRNVTGLSDFGKYLATMLEMDAFFLNEDRHTNNISILYNKNTDKYRLCPFYDMGLSLFSDTKVDFPLEQSYFECKDKVIAKPFCRDFDEQMDAANELFGSYLKFDFSANCITSVVEKLRGNEDGYTEQELKRVEETLRYQAAKYKCFF